MYSSSRHLGNDSGGSLGVVLSLNVLKPEGQRPKPEICLGVVLSLNVLKLRNASAKESSGLGVVLSLNVLKQE